MNVHLIIVCRELCFIFRHLVRHVRDLVSHGFTGALVLKNRLFSTRNFGTIYYYPGLSQAGGQVPPHFLTDHLTLSQPGEGGTLSPPSTMCPPGFSDLATALLSAPAILNHFFTVGNRNYKILTRALIRAEGVPVIMWWA
jgi:hypothetical protein